MKVFRVFAMLLLGLSIAFTSCQKEPEPISVTGISLDSSSLTLTEGESAHLTATISPSNADNQGVIWSSSNASVASVSNGTVTAVSAGSATITAKSDDGGKTATCNVTVNSKIVAVTGVSLDKTSLELTEGDEYTLVATVQPANASNTKVSWSSSDNSIASVENGKVKALKPGRTTISVKTEDGGKTANCEITVKEKIYQVESVSLDKTNLELTEGDEATLIATIKPDNASNKQVSWKSEDETIATVSNGKVKAIKPGKTTISVITSDGEKTASCIVTVKAFQPEIVDLGLSVKWASCNLGASKPEEYGDYYAWGELETKNNYTEKNYKYYKEEKGTDNDGFDVTFKGYTKYVRQADAKKIGFNCFYDDKIELDSNDDVVREKLGGRWRMPTSSELVELMQNCTFTWGTLNDIKGYKVTSNKKGFTDKWIFLPATGFYSMNSAIGVGENGYYRSSTLDSTRSDFAKRLYLINDGRVLVMGVARYYGFPIRPVCD